MGKEIKTEENPLKNSILKNSAAAASAGAAALIIYLLSAARGVPCGFDSAELISACASGGIAHPPGYPLYTFLGWMLCSLNMFSPAFTMNLFSAVCMSACCFLLCFSFSVLLKNRTAAFISTMLFASAASPWKMALEAEVFGLHLFFCALLICLAVLWKLLPAERRLLSDLLALSLGLSLSHHHTVLLLIPGLAVFICLNSRNEKFKFYWEMPLLFAAGLLPYIWLPWRSGVISAAGAGESSAFNWGDPSTLKNFFWTVSRSGYGSLQLSTKAADISRGFWLKYWLDSLIFRQFLIIGIIPGIYGIYKSWKDSKDIFFLLGIFLLLSGPFWALYAAQPCQDGYSEMMERFFASSYLAYSCFISLGLAALLNEKAKFKSIAAVMIVCCAINFAVNWNRCSERSLNAVDFTIESISSSISENSLVFAQSDMLCGGFLYAKAVKNKKFVLVPLGVCESDWFKNTLPEEYAHVLEHSGPAGLADWAFENGTDVYFDNERLASAFGLERQGRMHFIINDGLLWRFVRRNENMLDSDELLSSYLKAQHSMLTGQILSGFGTADLKFEKDQPFWHRFAVNMWQQSLKINKSGGRDDIVLKYEREVLK